MSNDVGLVQELCSVIEGNKTQIAALQRDLSAATKANDELSVQLAGYGQWARDATTERDIARTRLKHAQRAVETRASKIIEQQKIINDIRQELAEAKRQLGLARAQDQNTFAALEEELKCATNVIANLRDTIQTHVRARGLLAKELNEAKRTIADLRSPDLANIEARVLAWWFNDSGGFTPEVWNKMLWGVDPAKPGTDETVVTRVGRGQSRGGPAELHNLPKDTSASLQRKIARQAKTLREQEALIEKLKERLREVPRDVWRERTAARISVAAMPGGDMRDRVEVLFRNGSLTTRMIGGLCWGEQGDYTIVKWRRAS